MRSARVLEFLGYYLKEASILECMNRSDIGKAILKKWTDRDFQLILIRFLNGNTKDCSSFNLCYVDVEEAMVNFDTWVTDWDSGLTEEEKA
jgi:hypothetical protein